MTNEGRLLFRSMPHMKSNLSKFLGVVLAGIILCPFMLAQNSAAPQKQTRDAEGPQLTFVTVLSRHGVRSPLHSLDEYNPYSAAPWPQWPVPLGYLTPHGYELMRIFGSYYHANLSSKNLLDAVACKDASRVTIIADSGERTRESAKAIAEGMFPACPPSVQILPEGTRKLIFSGKRGDKDSDDGDVAVGTGEKVNLQSWVAANRPQLAMLDDILNGCGKITAENPQRISLLDLTEPKRVRSTENEEAAAQPKPLNIASSMMEDLLLEYTEGMKDPGWGCLDGDKLRYLMNLRGANKHGRSVLQARIRASGVLSAIIESMQQSISQKKIPGALGRPGDKMLFLLGHDGNIAAVEQALGMDWIIDGRRNDTPPGGALIFELWRSPDESYSVRVYYTAQTIDQMRNMEKLTRSNPPISIPLFVPNCSAWDDSCAWAGFQNSVERAIPPQARALREPQVL